MRIEGGRILDSVGRTLLLRGCNLGGSSKLPVAACGTVSAPEGSGSGPDVSFIGRPFPSEEADEHFSRLARWGFTFLRLVITWEAVEHTGPGIYDESYLAYLRKILKKAAEYGISVFIDPHQDVWSRWTGGDGAPAWTMEKLGFDLSLLDRTGAALARPPDGTPYPHIAWITNYNRYAAATMFTLFFAGDVYAPHTTVEGEDAKSWLQGRYFAAMRHAYRRLKDCSAIVGWGTMNEPHPGFIGYQDLSGLENCTARLGSIPDAFSAMASASGYPTVVPVYTQGLTGARRTGEATINPDGISLFKEGFCCPWKREGVWTDEAGEACLLRADWFAGVGGRKVSFGEDFLKPFLKRFTSELRAQKSDCAVFIEGVPHGIHTGWSEADGTACINAFHWYDDATLVTKRFVPWISLRSDTRKPVFGRKAVARSFAEQLAKEVAWTREGMAGMPCLLGEFGLPFDLNGRKAFRTGNWKAQEHALSLYYDAADANLLHSTIWNYTADNTNEQGDGWNGEDLSIWSRDREAEARGEADAGARAIAGWRRPYPMATAGAPLSLRWDRKRKSFMFRFRSDPAVAAPTEIYAPDECFGRAPRIRVLEAGGRNAEGMAIVRKGALFSIDTAGRDGEFLISIEAESVQLGRRFRPASFRG